MDVNSLALQVSNVATASAFNAWALIGNFLILAVLTLLMIAFSYYGGKGGIISLIMAFYGGYGLYLVFPYTSVIVDAGGTPLFKALISIFIFLVALFIPFIFIQRLTHDYGSP